MSNTDPLVKIDVEAAQRYALERLERELSPDLVYHSLGHTRDGVLPGVQKLAAVEGIGGLDLQLLVTAAAFHDLGFIVRFKNHELAGIEIATQVLPNYGYRPEDIAVIRGLILATRLPQSPQTHLEELIADADLDVLGRENFLERNRALRSELAANGVPFTERAWLLNQLQFLREHRYFSASARQLRDVQKMKNIALLAEMLAKLPPAELDPLMDEA